MVGPSLVLSTYYQILLQYITFILLFKLSLHIKRIYTLITFEVVILVRCYLV